jgi:hypothetical protein
MFMDATAIEYRHVVTALGDAYRVPQYIFRVDDDYMAGWQLRYGEWTNFQDDPAGKVGAEQALQTAIREMTSRVEYSGK